MSLSSLPLAKEVLGLNPTDEDWLQYCKIVGSPFGDVVIVASDKCAVFYVKKFDTDGYYFSHEEKNNQWVFLRDGLES